MKKLVKLGTLFISMILGVNITKAAQTCDDIEMYAQSDFWSRTGVNMNYDGINYNYSLYTLKDSSNVAFSSYCRNAGISAGKSFDGQKFKCKQVVFDTSTTNETKKTYDAGVIAILKNGYSARNNNTYPLDKNQEYTATNLALRTYEMLWPQINTNGSNNTKNNNAHKYYTNMWLDDAEITTLLRQASGTVRDKYSNAVTVSSWTYNGTNVTTNIVEEARRLIKLGLKSAVNYKQNGAATLSVSNVAKAKSPSKTENDITTYKMSLTYKVSVSKFTSDGAYVNANFNCANCNTYGVDYKIYINDKEVGKTISGNLLELDSVKKGTGTINIKIEFETTSSSYSCEELDYSLDFTYFDETISTTAYDMYSTSCYSNTSCQHFYMLYADDVAQKMSIEDTFKLCTLNCEELKAQCEVDKDANACKRFQEEYGGKCATCTSYISNDECSDEDSEIDVKEGYESGSGSCSISNQANILQCIINNEDGAGNSYRATNLANNKYCSVWCKEDYHFTMPGNKEVNSGRYFSLKASIKGTKTCYTSAINTSQFEADLESAQHKVVDSYNDYTFNKAATDALSKEKETTTTITVNYIGTTTTCAQSMASCQSAYNTCKSTYDACVKSNNENRTKLNSCNRQCRTAAACMFDETDAECISRCLNTCKSRYTKTCTSCTTCKSVGTINGVDCAKKSTSSSKTKETYTYKSYKNSFSWSGYTYSGGTTTATPGDYAGITHSGANFTYESNGSISCPFTCIRAGNTYTCRNVSEKCTVTDGVSMSTLFNSSNTTSKLNTLKSAYGVSTTSAGVFDGSGKPITPPSSSGVPSTSLIGVISNYNYCSAWNMDYTFEPDIHFWYEESYMNSVITDTLDTVGDVKVDKNAQTVRCAGTVDNAYESCSTGWTSSYLTKTKTLFVCAPDGSGCSSKQFTVATSSRMKSAMNAEGAYITPTQFYTIYPSGAIAVADAGQDIENATELPNALPVGLGTTQGVYNYTLIVKNLGEYYNNDELGRIWGDKNSVVSTTLEEKESCYKNAALTYDVNIDGTYFDEGVYTCAYKVNCPDCPVVCDPDCGNPDCPDGDCPTVCDPPCVYNNGDTNINYRPITPEDLNPNDRDLGKNWKFDEKNITTALELKAYTTTKEIEEAGETIYDINFESTESRFAMKVTMDSKMISKIRAYNDKYEDSVGFLNNTLKCYDHTNSNDGTVYKNVYCYSTFIDELLYDNDTKDNIKITPKNSRVIGTNASSTDNLRKTKTQTSGYWTTWSEANLNKLTITTEHGLAYYKANYGSLGVGPSWK